MVQTLSLAGAFLVLTAFVGLQMGRLAVDTVVYQLLNLVGAALLTTVGLLSTTWGFVVLNGVWSIVAIVKLWQLRTPGPAAPGGPRRAA
ncbi:CBU_0592 family membrane protein [Actinoplanes subglobosus]|uniref:CBU-0592-like domain-containing protein n=1 Tax=Actinoplanes subglobosus TaxID=1547892 RepID=A0ABV8IWH4_9ACTN